VNKTDLKDVFTPERLIVGAFIAFLVFAFIYGTFLDPDIAEGDKEFYGPSGVPD
jgi:hypothetical protein